MTFGEVLAQLMAERGIGPSELSRRSGVSRQLITELTKGRSKEPTFSKACRLAKGLDMTLEEIAKLTGN